MTKTEHHTIVVIIYYFGSCKLQELREKFGTPWTSSPSPHLHAIFPIICFSCFEEKSGTPRALPPPQGLFHKEEPRKKMNSKSITKLPKSPAQTSRVVRVERIQTGPLDLARSSAAHRDLCRAQRSPAAHRGVLCRAQRSLLRTEEISAAHRDLYRAQRSLPRTEMVVRSENLGVRVEN